MSHVKVRPRPRPKRRLALPVPRCDERQCRRPWTVECWLYDSDTSTDVLDGRYCGEHAVRNGFCRFCGTFNAGIESFDFNNPRGLCENCRSCETDNYEESEPDDVYCAGDELDLVADALGVAVHPLGIPDVEDEIDRMADLFITKR